MTTRTRLLEIENTELRDKNVMLEEQVAEQKMMIQHLVERLNDGIMDEESSVSTSASSRLSLSRDDALQSSPASSVDVELVRRGKHAAHEQEMARLRSEIGRLQGKLRFLQTQNSCYQLALDESYRNQIAKLGALESDYNNLKRTLRTIETNNRFVAGLRAYDDTEYTVSFDATKLRVGARRHFPA